MKVIYSFKHREFQNKTSPLSLHIIPPLLRYQVVPCIFSICLATCTIVATFGFGIYAQQLFIVVAKVSIGKKNRNSLQILPSLR